MITALIRKMVLVFFFLSFFMLNILLTVNIYSFKNSLLLCYLFSYYITLFSFILFFFFFYINKLSLLNELVFFSNYSFIHFYLLLTLITFAGLPPLLLFFFKLSLVSYLIINNTAYFAILSLILIFFGWFLYLTVAKTISYQTWSFTMPYEYGHIRINTFFSGLISFFFFFLLFGFFFITDIFLYFYWVVL